MRTFLFCVTLARVVYVTTTNVVEIYYANALSDMENSRPSVSGGYGYLSYSVLMISEIIDGLMEQPITDMETLLHPE